LIQNQNQSITNGFSQLLGISSITAVKTDGNWYKTIIIQLPLALANG